MSGLNLESYAFADEDSRAATLEAAECLRIGRRGAFLVFGPMMSGKSRLVRELLGEAYEETKFHTFPRSGSELARVLDVAASAKAVCFDNVRTRLKSEELECFLTSAERRFRVLGTNVMQVVENRCVVFVTTSEPILSGDLARRFRVIRLRSHEASAAGPVPLVSLEKIEDERYALLEVHTLPLEARKLEFLRIDGFWFVKASEGVNEAIEEAWRDGMQPAEGGGE